MNFSVGIVGLGYVGLKEAIAISKKDLKVIGFDINSEKVKDLNDAISPISTVSSQEIKNYLDNGSQFVDSIYKLTPTNIIIIAVPTPLTSNHDPDLSYIKKAVELIKEIYSEQIIVLESTTYPGCTREVIGEELLKKFNGVKFAFCGEREDPGGNYHFSDIPRVIGANNTSTLELVSEFYKKFIAKVHKVSSIEVAEITKIYENVYRSVNIGLVNEFKTLCIKMGIDPFEVIEAAGTKPFGFSGFFPGPGLGGHCIPIDPFYLTWSARKYNLKVQFIELSGIINSSMPSYVVSRIIFSLNTIQKSVRGSKILICGIAYKKNIEDVRESPAGPIIDELRNLGANITLFDPVVYKYQKVYRDLPVLNEIPANNGTLFYDISVILNNHNVFDLSSISEQSKMVVDTRGCLPVGEKVIRG